MGKRWYVVHTYSGHEHKVKQYIENMAPSSGVADRIGQVVVPVEEVVEMRDGKKVTTKRKLFPSYVLVEMVLDKDTQHFISSVPGVTSFVGPKKAPHPLRDEEVKSIMTRMEGGQGKAASGLPFQEGDLVKVVDGPFKNFTGTVDEVYSERHKVRVMVSIFGRPTPVELDVLQVEKVMPEMPGGVRG
ncbi:MAG TPA: transcription termination/antitermination factor NusG [Candidatus Latescibacteria bacterium]|nr:transcription termination/antitermination factor NusG [Candidatus Latescibacterota bacterium]